MLNIEHKSVIFVTGTRADFGKINPLVEALAMDPRFETHIFITGMHMLREYGHTYLEVLRKAKGKKFTFINQRYGEEMDTVFAKTIQGFADYIREQKPDLVVIHGDRVEALACSIVAMLNGIRIAHIEGGEISGTIDESMRHAVTKLSNLHFVSNQEAFRRLNQLGEDPSNIFVIGSPEVDIMNSKELPSILEVKDYYNLNFTNYGICIFHSVTTEVDLIAHQSKVLVESMIASKKNFLVILPNNDSGASSILSAYKEIESNPCFRILPSLRFEYYLVALKNADFIIGNSSSGVREAPYFAVPSINLGSRQKGRANAPTIVNCDFDREDIINAIHGSSELERTRTSNFGDGNAGERFHSALKDRLNWETPVQKHFIDF